MLVIIGLALSPPWITQDSRQVPVGGQTFHVMPTGCSCTCPSCSVRTGTSIVHHACTLPRSTLVHLRHYFCYVHFRYDQRHDHIYVCSAPHVLITLRRSWSQLPRHAAQSNRSVRVVVWLPEGYVSASRALGGRARVSVRPFPWRVQQGRRRHVSGRRARRVFTVTA